jgi:hypothetical protein
MGMFIFKALSIFVLIYSLWFLSGGVERGERRHARGDESYFVGIDITQDGELVGSDQENESNEQVAPFENLNVPVEVPVIEEVNPFLKTPEQEIEEESAQE